MAQTVADNLRELTFSILDVKEKFATNLADKGVSSITTANTLNQMADSISGITTGGGGGNPNAQWEEIGYTSQPQHITDGIEYAKKIQANWNPNKYLYRGFMNDKKLVYFPLVDTHNCSEMYQCFANCINLQTVPEIDVSKITKFQQCFQNCKSLKSVPKFKFSSATELNSFFENCESLISVPDFDTSSPTIKFMSGFFSGCKSLTTAPLLDVSKIQNMGGFFDFCNSLTTVPLLDTSSNKDFRHFFRDCSSLKSIPKLNFSKGTDMNGCFDGCGSLTIIPELETSNVIDMCGCFYGCESLISIESINMSNVTKNDIGFLRDCNKLRKINIIGLGTQSTLTSMCFGTSWNLIKTIGIDGDGAIGCRQALIDTLLTNSFDRASAGYSTFSITLSPETKALLSEGELAAITAKGFTIA